MWVRLREPNDPNEKQVCQIPGTALPTYEAVVNLMTTVAKDLYSFLICSLFLFFLNRVARGKADYPARL